MTHPAQLSHETGNLPVPHRKWRVTNLIEIPVWCYNLNSEKIQWAVDHGEVVPGIEVLEETK